MTTGAAASGTLSPSRAEELRDRLDDPAVAGALSELLDHIGLVALLISGLDGFVRRSEVTLDSLAGGISELRTGVTGKAASADLPALAAGLTALSGAAREGAPA